MTWFVSPEEWLLDFTVIPRGRPRGGESLDVVDDRLRAMLAPPTTAAGIVIPSITASRRASGAVSTVTPPKSESGPRPVATAIVAPPEPPPPSGLTVELHRDDESPIPPPPPSGGMVIPSLTRPGHPLADDEHADTDDAEVLERLSPVGGHEPGIGIPRDDDGDALFSAVASSAMMFEPPPPEAEPRPEPEPEPAPITVEPIPVEESAPVAAHHDEEEIDGDALEDHDEVIEARDVKQPSKPAPAAPPRPPTPAAPPVSPAPVVEKPVVPRPPPAPVEKAGPPKPPPTPEKPVAPPRPPPAAKPAPMGGRTLEPPPGKKKRQWTDEAFADYYPSITPLDADASAELDVAFIKTCLDLTSGQTLLDVACGDGRHAIAFAAHGLDVTGLDSSMPQLLRAAKRNESGRFSFDILHGDMRALPRDRTYDVVSCLGSSIGYFEAEETNRQCLQDMVEVLKPGGKLALHAFNRDYLMSVLPCRSWWQGRGCLVLDVADMHFFSSRMRVHRTVVFEDGRQFEHHIWIRAYSVNELGKILTQAGARVLEVSGGRDTRGRFYGASSPDIWLFAQRRDDV